MSEPAITPLTFIGGLDAMVCTDEACAVPVAHTAGAGAPKDAGAVAEPQEHSRN